jgi:hypothetical protein
MKAMPENVGFIIVPRRGTPNDSLKNHRVGHMQVDDGVELLSKVREEVIEKARLGHGAGKTVQDRARARWQMTKDLLDHGIDEFVGDQFPILNELAREKSEGSAVTGLLPQDIAEGNGVELLRRGEGIDERALAGTGGT